LQRQTHYTRSQKVPKPLVTSPAYAENSDSGGADDIQSPASARKTVVMIAERIGKLRQFPLLGPALSSIVAFDCDTRFLVCGSYMAFYHIEGQRVLIDRVLYGRRDYLAVLFGEEPYGE
jgi:plasmid stabilization system protein ParE